jgi:hypothetical protein
MDPLFVLVHCSRQKFIGNRKEKFSLREIAEINNFKQLANSSNGGTWDRNNASLSLAISNNMYDGNILGIGPPAPRLSEAEFDKLDGEEKFFRQYESFILFSTSDNGAIATIHELIHQSINGHGKGGAGDIELATVALELTGQRLDLSGLSPRQAAFTASAIWDDRLRQACGLPANHDPPKYNKHIK